MKRILMVVFNEIDYDSRVQRSVEFLQTDCEVTLIAIKGKGFYENKLLKLIELERSGNTIRDLIHFFVVVLKFAYKGSYDFIFLNDYYFAGLGFFLNRILKQSVVYDSHELIIPFKKFHSTKRDRFFYFIERANIRFFSCVIAANRQRAKIMKIHYKLKRTPSVIRNVSKSPEIDKMQFKNIKPIIKIIYQGDISYGRGLNFFLEALKEVDDIEFNIVGGGPDLEKVKQFAIENNLSNYIVHGKVSQKELYRLIRESHVGIITYLDSDINNKYCSPNKIFEYAFSGVPILSSGQPPLVDYLTEFQIGKFISFIEVKEDIKNALKDIMDHYENYRERCFDFIENFKWTDDYESLKRDFEIMGLYDGKR